MFQQARIFNTAVDSSLSSIFSAGSGLVWLYLLIYVLFLFLGIDVYLVLIMLNFKISVKFGSLPWLRESPADEEFISLLIRPSDILSIL